MPRINNIDALENRLLSNFSQGHVPPNYINRLVCPPIPVTRNSGNFMQTENGIMLYDDERAPRTNAKQIDFDLGKAPWTTEEHALESNLDEAELEAARDSDNPFSAEMDLKRTAIQLLMHNLEARREYITAQRVFGEAYYDSAFKTDVGSDPWNDQTSGGSDPIGDIMTGVRAVRAMGAIPNTLVMSYDTFVALAQHPALVANFKVQMGMLTKEQVMNCFPGIKNIIVGDGMYNSGTASAPVLTPFWGNHCSIIPVHSLMEMQAGNKVHTVMFDKVKDTKSYEGVHKLLTYIIQRVRYGALTISDKHGYLIQNTIGA